MLTLTWMEDVFELQKLFAIVPTEAYHGFELQCRMCRQKFFATDHLSALIMHQWIAREEHERFNGETQVFSAST